MIILLEENSSPTWDMFGKISPKLGVVFFSFVNELAILGEKTVTITSIIRPKTGDSGVHELGRGIDVRNDFSDQHGLIAMDIINAKYPYDLMRPGIKTCIYHKTDTAGDAGWHFHLQVLG